MEQLEVKQDEEYYEPTMDIGSRARILSRRLKQLNKSSAYDDPEDADNEDSKNELGIKRKKRIRVSARHNNAVQNRMKQFDVGKPTVVEPEVKPMRRKLKNSEFLKKIETFGGNGSEETQIPLSDILMIPNARAAQRESIRNIKTTLSTRKKNFLHLHNTGFKPQSKPAKEQDIAPIPKPRRKVRVASVKQDKVAAQEQNSASKASDDESIASKEKKTPPKKPPRRLRVSVKRVSTRKLTKSGEMECTRTAESEETRNIKLINSDEQLGIKSMQSGETSVLSRNADLNTAGSEEIHLGDKPSQVSSFKSVKRLDESIPIRKVRVSRVSRKKISLHEHTRQTIENSDKTKTKLADSGEKTEATNSPVCRRKASTKNIIANINSFKSSRKQSSTNGRRHASERNKNNNENNENAPPKPSRRRYRKKYLKLFMEAAHSGEDSEGSIDSCSSEPLQSKKKIAKSRCLTDEEDNPNLSKNCGRVNMQSFRAYDISDIVSGLNASSGHIITNDDVISSENVALATEDHHEKMSKTNEMHSIDAKTASSNTNDDYAAYVQKAAGVTNQILNFGDVEPQIRSDAKDVKPVDSYPSPNLANYSHLASNVINETMNAVQPTSSHQAFSIKSDQSTDISCNDSLPVYDRQSTLEMNHKVKEEKQHDNDTEFNKYDSVIIHRDVENNDLDPLLLKGLEEQKTNFQQKKQYRDKFLADFNAAEINSTDEKNTISLEKKDDEPISEHEKEQKSSDNLSAARSNRLEGVNKELTTQLYNELTTLESNITQQNVANNSVLSVVSAKEVDRKQSFYGCNENDVTATSSVFSLSTTNNAIVASIDAEESVYRKNAVITNEKLDKKRSCDELNEVEALHITEVEEISNNINQKMLSISHNHKEIEPKSLMVDLSDGNYYKSEVDTRLNTEPITVLINLEDISFEKPNALKNDEIVNDGNESNDENIAADRSNMNYEVCNKVDVDDDKDVAVSDNQVSVCMKIVDDKADYDKQKEEVDADKIDNNIRDDVDALHGKNDKTDAWCKVNVNNVDENVITTKIEKHDDKSDAFTDDQANTQDGNVTDDKADVDDGGNLNNAVGDEVEFQHDDKDDDEDKGDVQIINVNVDDKDKDDVHSNNKGNIGNVDYKDKDILFHSDGDIDDVHDKNKDASDKTEVYSNDSDNDDKSDFYFHKKSNIDNVHDKDNGDGEKVEIQSDDNEDKDDYDDDVNKGNVCPYENSNDDTLLNDKDDDVKVEVEIDDDDETDVDPDNKNADSDVCDKDKDDDDDDKVEVESGDDDKKKDVRSKVENNNDDDVREKRNDNEDNAEAECDNDDDNNKDVRLDDENGNDDVVDEVEVYENEDEEDGEFEVEYAYLDEDGNEIAIDVADLDAFHNHEAEGGSDDEIEVEYVYESDSDTDDIVVYLDDDGNYVDENGMPVELELDSDDEIVYEE